MSEQEVSSEPISTEIGSGEIESQAVEESGNGNEISGDQAEAIDSGVEEIEQAIAEGASEEEVQEMIEVFKYKANGREYEKEIDWNDKEGIKRMLSMAESAPNAMQDKAEMERFWENKLDLWQKNPWMAAEELGYDPDELAEGRIQSRIAELQKSPQQIEQEARQNELEELRARLRQQDDERQEVEFSNLQQQYEVDLDQQITEALSSTTELPKTPYIVKRIADAMLSAMENGYEDVSVNDVVPVIERELNGEFQNFFESMNDKTLNKYMGNNIIDRLRNQRLNTMKTNNLNNLQDTGRKPPGDSERKKKQSIRDFLKNGVS